MDRETALRIYNKVIATYEGASISCIDVSEVVNTHGLSPLYELHIKNVNSEALREAIGTTVQAERIIITETGEGIFIV